MVQPPSRSRASRRALGWRSLHMACASIWRIRSRVRWKWTPTSSSVRGRPRSRPKRSIRISRSRRSSTTSILATSVDRRAAAAASNGDTALVILDKVAQIGVPVAAKRLGQRHGPADVAEDLRDFRFLHPQVDCQLGDGGTAPELAFEAAAGLAHPVQEVAGVDREAHRAPAVGDAPADGLADPPGGVGRELESLPPVELLDRVDQPEVALLDQVEQREFGGLIFPGDRHHQAKVGRYECVRRQLTVANQPAQLAPAAGRDPAHGDQFSLGLLARFDGLSEANLVIFFQQVMLAYIIEIEPNEILFRLGISVVGQWSSSLNASTRSVPCRLRSVQALEHPPAAGRCLLEVDPRPGKILLLAVTQKPSEREAAWSVRGHPKLSVSAASAPRPVWEFVRLVGAAVLAATLGAMSPNAFVASNHLTVPAVTFRLPTHAYPRSRSKETLLNAPAGAASRGTGISLLDQIRPPDILGGSAEWGPNQRATRRRHQPPGHDVNTGESPSPSGFPRAARRDGRAVEAR